jgi:GINS complex subunit 4
MSDDDDFNFSGYNDRISASREPDVEAIDPAGDVAHLTQAWIDERAAPDLLQYQEQCIQRLLAKIEEQVSQGSTFPKPHALGARAGYICRRLVCL